MEQFQIQDFIITYNNINDPEQKIEKRVNRTMLLFYLSKLSEGKIGAGVSSYNLADNVSNEAKEAFIDAAQGKQICFDSQIVYQLEHLCKNYGNDYLKSKITVFIQKIPQLHSTILRIIFKIDFSKESYKEEANEIAEKFAEAIKIVDLYKININFIIEQILDNPNFTKDLPENQHAILSYIKYIHKIENNSENNNAKEINETLKGIAKKYINFDNISEADIFDLKILFNDSRNNNNEGNLISEAQLKRITTIDEILNGGNKDLEKIETNIEKIKADIENEKTLITTEIKNANEKIESAKYIVDPQTHKKVLKIEYEQERLNKVEEQALIAKKMYDNTCNQLSALENTLKDVSHMVEKVQAICDELEEK